MRRSPGVSFGCRHNFLTHSSVHPTMIALKQVVFLLLVAILTLSTIEVYAQESSEDGIAADLTADESTWPPVTEESYQSNAGEARSAAATEVTVDAPSVEEAMESAGAGEETMPFHTEDILAAQARMLAKPWYNREIHIGSVNLMVTPVTLLVGWLSCCYILSIFFGSGDSKSSMIPTCDASHILLADQSEVSKKKLEDLKKTIGTDAAKFAEEATKRSCCPSKKNGGKLGRFKRHDMAPQFDRVCFDPNTPLQTTIGPVQTNFGWHLIYIHQRENV